jgi:hypothetical protein
LDRLELIRFLQVAQTLTVHHGALAYLLGINALRASEAAAVRIEDYSETLRGHRVLHLVSKGTKPRHHAVDRPGAPRSGTPAAATEPKDPWYCALYRGTRATAATVTGWCCGSRRQRAFPGTLVPSQAVGGDHRASGEADDHIVGNEVRGELPTTIFWASQVFMCW